MPNDKNDAVQITGCDLHYHRERPTFSSSFLKFVLNPSSVNRALSWCCTIVFDE